MKQTLTRRLKNTVRDRNGRVVLWQAPNLPLWIWMIATAGRWALPGPYGRTAGWVAAGALLVWSVLELTSGVNLFRRALGGVILTATLHNIARQML